MRRMNWAGIGLLLVTVAGCGDDSVTCYVGGTMRPVMQKLADVYEQETGQKVVLDYADSGTLLTRIEESQRGDLYVCHDPFLDVLMARNLGADGYVVAGLTPMIAVPKGNPKGIQELEDLARPGMRVGLTDEMYSTLGHILPYMFKKLPAGVADTLRDNVKTRMRSGGETANQVILDKLDAAIVWNAVIHARREKLDMVDIEDRYRPDPSVDVVTSASPGYSEMDMSAVAVTIATLKCSDRLDEARRFAEFVNSERARQIFAEYGFSPAPRGPATQTAPSATTQ